jgi:hypothetical protein
LDDISLLVVDDDFAVGVEDSFEEVDEALTEGEEVMVLLTETALVEVLTVVLVGIEAWLLLDEDFEVERDDTLETLVVLDIELVGEDFELEREDLLEVFVVLDVELLGDSFWLEVAGALELRIEDTLKVFIVLEMFADEIVLLAVVDLELESTKRLEILVVLDGVLLDEIWWVEEPVTDETNEDFNVLDGLLVDEIFLVVVVMVVEEIFELESSETLVTFVVLDIGMLGEENLLLDVLETFELDLKVVLEILEKEVDIFVLVVDEVVFEVEDAILTHDRAVSVE